MTAVYTVGEICKKCYSCVRACPTKAIEVHSGQADINEALCISCGYCVTMCSQGAKRIRSSVSDVKNLLADNSRHRAAIIAPSFPAAYLDIAAEHLVGALKELGFDGVYEVAYGADLVSREYEKAFREKAQADDGSFLISSPCPSVVSYVENERPELIPYLTPIASPMEAMARYIRSTVEANAGIVFIGPCVAKKDEALRTGAVNEVLTFEELLELFEDERIEPRESESYDFDPPRANLGAIYPITGGLLKAAAIDDDIIVSPVYVVEGQERVVDILDVLTMRVKNGEPVVNRFFDLLFCEGCIAGPSFPNDLSCYERRKYIINHLKQRQVSPGSRGVSPDSQPIDITALDLSVTFTAHAHREAEATEQEIREILAKTNKFAPEDELNCRACGYASCRDKARAVFRGKAEVEMCLPYLISKLETTITDLRGNQAKLIQAEKLASMGQMAAGIAHEINNPLGVVLMYAHLLKEELDGKGVLSDDADMIIREADRTRKIVQGILNFARKEKIERTDTDINALLRSAASAIRSLDPHGTIDVRLDLDEKIGSQWVDPNQLRQVFDNITKNAVEFMPDGGAITITSRAYDDEFTVRISDTGPGIPEGDLGHLFSPFFTTKPVGKGTGLGLPVCYGIVKMHGGSIQAGNNADGGAFFHITITHTTKEAESAAYSYS